MTEARKSPNGSWNGNKYTDIQGVVRIFEVWSTDNGPFFKETE